MFIKLRKKENIRDPAIIRRTQSNVNDKKHMVSPTFLFEEQLRKQQCQAVVGIDEAGYGPLAGPVVAAAVVFSHPFSFPTFLRDSKQLTERQRKSSYKEILEKAKDIGIGISSVKEINTHGIRPATNQAMQRAVKKLKKFDFLLVDGIIFPFSHQGKTVIKGDRQIASIAAASIVAKVVRDAFMIKSDQKYPDYEFASHKGYGTKRHFFLLKKYGPCAIHRTSWSCFEGID